MSASIVPFRAKKKSRGQFTPAAAGDLIIGRMRGLEAVWLVLVIAAVDDDGAVAMVTDVDGKAIGIGRIFVDATANPTYVSSRRLTTDEGVAHLSGLCNEDIEALKAEFRQFVPVPA